LRTDGCPVVRRRDGGWRLGDDDSGPSDQL